MPVSCSVPDLVAAINTANNQPGADTLSLATGCTYRLTIADNAANGLPVITSDITINGNNATITRGSSAPAFRILFVSSAGTLTLNKATISGGAAADCPSFLPSACGGCVSNLGTMTVNDSRVINNTATSSVFAEGGGIDSDGTATVNNTEVSGNTATYTGTTDSAAAQGGGLANAVGSATLNRSTVAGNNAGDGGGIFEDSGTVTLNNSVVRGNSPNNCRPPGSVPGCIG